MSFFRRAFRAPAIALAPVLGLVAALPAFVMPAAAMTPVQVVTSPGGVTAWLVEEHAIPMVALEIMFDTGADLDLDGKPGATYYLSGMLDEGAGDLDSAAFSAKADELALRFGFDAGRDALSVSAKMLTENLDEAAQLLRLALTAPRFDAEPMERVRAQILSGLRSRATDPDDIVEDAWRKTAFPAGDTYARPIQGDEASITAMTADDLRAQMKIALNRSKIYVGVVGDIDAERLKPLLDTLLGDLPDTPLERPGQIAVSPEGGLQVVDFDAPQAVARLTAPGILRDDPDFMPAYVMNHILGGGGFSSRLTEQVREKRGLTYSVWSYLAPWDRAGVYIAGVASDNAKIAKAVEVIRAEWARMAEDGVTQEELDNAKRYLTGAYPLRFDSNGKIAGQLAGLMADGYTPDYIEKRNALIEAVTLEDVNRAAKRLLKPEELHVTVVGRPVGMGEAPADTTATTTN